MLAYRNTFEKKPELLNSGHFLDPGGRTRVERAGQMECAEGEAEQCAMSPPVTSQIVLKSLQS